jgi:hypothetical protein
MGGRLRAMAGRFGAALLALGVAAACESPTLPLPPPATPDVTAGVDSAHVNLSSPCGGVENNADVEIINTNPTVPAGDLGVVVGASGCGSWSAQVYAHAGDELNILQQFENTTSAPITVQVPQGE